LKQEALTVTVLVVTGQLLTLLGLLWRVGVAEMVEAKMLRQPEAEGLVGLTVATTLEALERQILGVAEAVAGESLLGIFSGLPVVLAELL
jgi:hypothetical protein